MSKVFLYNDSSAPKMMGGKLVPPGEGREVDQLHLPPGEGPDSLAETLAGAGGDDEDADAKAAALNHQALVDALARPLSAVMPELPDYNDEALATMATLEGESDTPRKTLLEAIGALQLKRAQAKAGGEPT
jgi:hypothetical protein